MTLDNILMPHFFFLNNRLCLLQGSCHLMTLVFKVNWLMSVITLADNILIASSDLCWHLFIWSQGSCWHKVSFYDLMIFWRLFTTLLCHLMPHLLTLGPYVSLWALTTSLCHLLTHVDLRFLCYLPVMRYLSHFMTPASSDICWHAVLSWSYDTCRLLCHHLMLVNNVLCHVVTHRHVT